MEQADEIEQLLGEIPRATSAPSHVEVLNGVSTAERLSGSDREISPFEGYMNSDDIYNLYQHGSLKTSVMDGLPYVDPALSPPDQVSLFYRGSPGNVVHRDTCTGQEENSNLPCSDRPSSSSNSHSAAGSLSSAFGNLSLDNGSSTHGSPLEVLSAGSGYLDDELLERTYSQLDDYPSASDRCTEEYMASLNSTRLLPKSNDYMSLYQNIHQPVEFVRGLPNGSNDVYLTSHNYDMASVLQARKAERAMVFQLARIEEERQRQRQRFENQYYLQQQQQEQLYGQALLAAAVAPYSALGSSARTGTLRQSLSDGWLDYSHDKNHNSQSGNVCRYFAQGYCSRGEVCPYLHTQAPGTGSLQDKALRRTSRGIISVPRKNSEVDAYTNGLTTSGNGLAFQLDVPRNQTRNAMQEAYEFELKYSSLEDVEGHIYSIAKDQHGCRFLQRKFDEGQIEDLQKIFVEIIDHIVDLMMDPFGNYLVQKLLEVCNEFQRSQILEVVTAGQVLVTISLNTHGTRAVQKLIETLKSPEQVSMIISSLKHGVVALIKDLNGNHVIQRCLQRLDNKDSEFIFDAAAEHCVEIATHRHGCCVLQRCVDFATGSQRDRLVAEIAGSALVLSQDQYGNYVVQYILDLEIEWASREVTVRLEGNYALLAMQKFSSNVVEKCLKQAGDERRGRIVDELTKTSLLGQLLQDPFANYVIQCALSVTKGSIHSALVEAIRPHLPALRSSPYGKRILSRTNNLKK